MTLTHSESKTVKKLTALKVGQCRNSVKTVPLLFHFSDLALEFCLLWLSERESITSEPQSLARAPFKTNN